MFVIKITGTDPEVSHGKIKKAIEAGLDDFDIEWDRIHIAHEQEPTVSIEDRVTYLVKPGRVEEI